MKKEIATRIRLRNKETGKRIKVSFLKPEPMENQLDPRPSMLEKATKCWGVIGKEKFARKATIQLDEKGCSWVPLLQLIEQYSMAVEAEYERASSPTKKHLPSINRKIRKLRVKVANWKATAVKINEYIEGCSNVIIAPHTPDFDAYDAALHLAEISVLPSAWLPRLTKEPLAYLYHLIQISTGRAHYKELAAIITARLGQSKANTPRAIEITISRFKSEEPQLFAALRTGAKALVRDAPFSDLPLPPA